MTTEPETSNKLDYTSYASRFVADMDHAHEAYHDGCAVGQRGGSNAARVANLVAGCKVPPPTRWETTAHRAEVAADWLAGGYWLRDTLDKDGDARVAMREISAVLLRFYEQGVEIGAHARTLQNNRYSTLREGALSTLSQEDDS